MKKIAIKNIKIRNFKCFKNLELNFSNKNIIIGDNAEGKTSIYDAYLWCLFGKNSEDKKEFTFKNIFYQQDEEISVEVFLIENENISHIFKREIKERFDLNNKFTGNETKYYYNNVAVKATEYNNIVNNLFDEKYFKLLSNIYYFFDLRWEDRRAILLNLIDKEYLDENYILSLIGDNDIINSINERKRLNIISNTKFLEFLNSNINLIKNDIQNNKIRISENYNNINKYKDYSIEEILNIINDLNDIITDKNNDLKKIKENKNKTYIELINKNNELLLNIKALQNEIQKIKYNELEKLNNEKNNLNLLLNNLNNSLKLKSNQAQNVKFEIEQNKNKIQTLNNDKNKLLNEKLEIDERATKCKMCGQTLPNHKEIIEKMIKDYNINKSNKITEIDKNINKLNEDINKLENEYNYLISVIEKNKLDIEDIKNKISDIDNKINNFSLSEDSKLKIEYINNEINKTNSIIEENNKKINDIETNNDNLIISNIEKEISSLKDEISLLTNELKIKQRIEELKIIIENNQNKIAQYQVYKNSIEKFERMKSNIIEEQANKCFSFVQFKLFKENINGTIENACNVYINNVPYEDANYASKINAGIEIINVLSIALDYFVPLFVDNTESVSQIIPSYSQTIYLEKVKNEKLKIINQ